MNKTLKFTVAILMSLVVIACYSHVKASAATNVKVETGSMTPQNTKQDKVFVFDKTGKQTQAKTISKASAKKLVNAIKGKQSYSENGIQIQGNKAYSTQKPIKGNNFKVKKVEVYLALVEFYEIFDVPAKTITTKTTLVAFKGKKPLSIATYNDLQKANSQKGTYYTAMKHEKTFKGAQVKIGSSSKKTYHVTETHFYKTRHGAVATWGLAPQTTAGVTAPLLLNKKLAQYPKQILVIGKHEIKLPMIASTKWKELPASKRVKRSDKAIKDLKKHYEKKYNNGKPINWKGYEIHHVRPLQFGGNNDLSNLYPLDYTIHRSQMTPWFRAY